MARQNNWRRCVPLAGLLLFAGFAALLLVGCSPMANGPTNLSNSEKKLEWLNENFNSNGAQRSGGLDQFLPLYDTLIIDSVDTHGNTFKIVNGKEKIEFKVPDHALASPLTLTIHVTKFQAPFGSFWLLDCGPEGTVFAKPIEVKPNDQVTKFNVAVLFYFNPLTNSWEIQQFAGPNSKLQIYHFSKYGIS